MYLRLCALCAVSKFGSLGMVTFGLAFGDVTAAPTCTKPQNLDDLDKMLIVTIRLTRYVQKQ